MRQFWFSMEELRQIGKNIRKFRVKRDMTQLDLAAACNFDESAVGRLENGNTNPTIKTLLKIAKALGVKLTDLVKLK
jgi:transcriptional regulator with XRE-family HTH domain